MCGVPEDAVMDGQGHRNEKVARAPQYRASCRKKVKRKNDASVQDHDLKLVLVFGHAQCDFWGHQ